MITIQRTRVRWSAAARGAPDANSRRGLCRPTTLPLSPDGADVLIHDILVEEAAGYTARDEVTTGGLERARDLDLWLSVETSTVLVDRLPGSAAYPRLSGPARLFKLLPGQTGRYRANFRFTVTTCACNSSWFYEDWLILIANGDVSPDGFTARAPDHSIDHRVHLYGGASRPHRR
ncbi:hypothetical protein [Paractinoplanes toevensis]|uniref:Uncharacterized protein n=1 Tax=Paractinoplanes toevensis TaxID=571911 RepID=A0A919W1H5_9ACTN|nr:hypothetical protein [Actinoplanes toevensis]GIM90424.1 hypothetical protein Ato02nite_022170 [Actinoplanes toevensis]